MKKNILIIEDDPSVSNMVAQIFKDKDFNTIQVFDGRSALTEIYRHHPDLIILDILLPDIDGFNICKMLKIERDTNHIPIIMLTGLSSSENISMGLKVGADGYITKPFDIHHLLSEANKLLSLKDKYRGSEIISFTLNSELRFLNQLTTLISLSLNRSKLSSVAVAEVKSGVYEIVANAIEWGNQFQNHLLVHVDYQLLKESVTVMIKDEGMGFDCEGFMDPDYHPLEYQDGRLLKGKRLGGFGIKMTLSYFNHVSYNREEKQVILKRLFN